MTDPSPATVLATRLVTALGKPAAHRALDVILAKLTNIELAALAYDWSNVWARPKQLAPPGEWRSWGFLGARGMGKTRSVGEFITAEVMAGNAKCIGMAAQNLTKTEAVQVAGLIEIAPPWFRPRYEKSVEQLVWPNGARAYAFTPEVPGAIRSPNFDLAWLSEVQSWPIATREEAYTNFLFATRIGKARTVWDATPKKRNPLLRKLLDRAAKDPARHVIVSGTIWENAANLGAGIVDDLVREYGGTSKGREEIEGQMLEDSENALVRQDWIDGARRHMPDVMVRRVLGIDPAITNRAGNDATGIVECGLGVDGQVYVLGDYSGRYEAAAWGAVVLDKYVKNACDRVVVETNKGGHLVTQNLRAAAGARGLHIVVIGAEEKPTQVSGTVYVREVHARGPKEDRAQPLATAYERGRVSHVLGADLAALEDTLTTWEPTPGQRSPDALDALVHAGGELLGLGENRGAAETGFIGIAEFAKALVPTARAAERSNLAALLRTGSGGGRI